MFEIPIQDVAIVHKQVAENVQSMSFSSKGRYDFSEVDLSFYDALAGLCSGEGSSGPTSRPTRGKAKAS